MEDDLLNQYKSKYPLFLSKIEYISIKPGWYPLINTVFKAIEFHLKTFPPEINHLYHAIQIKEKFGTLRIYCDMTTSVIDGIIYLAEELSSHICELCASMNATQHTVKHYIMTLCPDCQVKRIKNQL